MLNTSIDNIRLDINHRTVKHAVYVRKADTCTRTIHCTLVDNGKVISLENASIVQFRMKKSDDTEVDNGCVVSGNEIQYTLRTNDIAVVGEGIAEFVVTFSDESVLRSPQFSIFVLDTVIAANAVESVNEYGTFTQYVVETQKNSEEAAKSATSASSYATTASEAAQEATTAAETAVEAKETAVDSARLAADAQDAAETAAENAATSEANAKESETNAETAVNQFADDLAAYTRMMADLGVTGFANTTNLAGTTNYVV